MVDNNVVPETVKYAKGDVKAKLAAGLQRAVSKYGKDAIAKAGECEKRTIENALAHNSVPELHFLLNMLDADPTVLDELFAAKGYRIVPRDTAMCPDMKTVAEMSSAVSNFIGALEDGRRDHRETLELAHLLRPLVPKLTAIVHEADGLRRVA